MPEKLHSLVKSSLDDLRDYKYHRKINRQAANALKSIKKDSGNELDDRNRKLCDEYAIDVLGHKHFAPWLYVYSVVSGGFKEGWIPDNYYSSVVAPKLKGVYGQISFLNSINSTIFQCDAFPNLLSYANGIFFAPDGRFVPKNQ